MTHFADTSSITMSETYKYEDGWRMVSKYAFGTALHNIYTNDVVITDDTRLQYIIASTTVEGGTINASKDR